MTTKLMRTTGLLAGLMASAAVSAHAGHAGHTAEGGLVAGLLHPLGGIDHLLVLMVLGLWACRGNGRPDNLGPAAVFLSALLVGAGLALAGVLLPATEAMIAVSVVLGGLVLARQVRADLLGAACFGALGLFHGQAHMAGLPGQAEPLRSPRR